MSKTSNGSGGAAQLLHSVSVETQEHPNALLGESHPLASVAGMFADDSHLGSVHRSNGGSAA